MLSSFLPTLACTIPAQETATKEVHEDTEQMRVFDELKSNQFGDSKDGLIGNA